MAIWIRFTWQNRDGSAEIVELASLTFVDTGIIKGCVFGHVFIPPFNKVF